MFSEELETIFIHTPKCGSSSMRNMLEDAGFQRFAPMQRVAKEIQWIAQQEGQATRLSHQAPDLWERSFKFAVCRNPYDRLVSGWAYGLKRGQLDVPFEYFVRNLETFRSFWAVWHCVFSQKQHLSVGGVPKADLVCRLEHLDSDLAPLRERIGQRDLTIPHVNRSSHASSREMYTRELQNIVFQRFAPDFEYFGYDYDL